MENYVDFGYWTIGYAEGDVYWTDSEEIKKAWVNASDPDNNWTEQDSQFVSWNG